MCMSVIAVRPVNQHAPTELGAWIRFPLARATDQLDGKHLAGEIISLELEEKHYGSPAWDLRKKADEITEEFAALYTLRRF
ncbi:hypothetical protein T265_11091 [Opisthorchis viverrini]|uniref:Uncharacterized protein n=1 Tax=Opisthorchis viverrini TaxID=6198 RepID=A0A074YZX4_OPIVI|nr:hypothetical protein T265_11090 [Opisthorchis viverrini]XP_009175918.1 hypothetical protein T265_11091 [Opisthorchis viverrini]KER20340.1 hypothetical protein T265_11090 [Opisthorchis viverrini]KER20341.1 hypothetical protein T265_11091 [Opisthorchis viverrini]